MHNILILDDEEDTLFLYEQILKKSGRNIITYPHCNNIFEMIKKHQPDVIIIDNAIPDDGGVAAIKKIKGNGMYKEIPVILVTANLKTEAIAKAAGADSFLQKPFDIDQLKQLVTLYLK